MGVLIHMVDVDETRVTVPAMTIAIVVLVAVLVAAAGVWLLKRTVASRVEGALRTAHENTGKPGNSKARQIAEAYQRGEIDEKMIKSAAKVLGISADEANARLSKAADAPVTDSELVRAQKIAKANQIAARRKKNKQSRKSRQGNRR